MEQRRERMQSTTLFGVAGQANARCFSSAESNEIVLVGSPPSSVRLGSSSFGVNPAGLPSHSALAAKTGGRREIRTPDPLGVNEML